jgi:hypothetical protein
MESGPIDVLVLTPLSGELSALRDELGKADNELAEREFSYVVWRGVDLKDRPEGGSLVAVMPLEKDQIPAGNTSHLALNRPERSFCRLYKKAPGSRPKHDYQHALWRFSIFGSVRRSRLARLDRRDIHRRCCSSRDGAGITP